MNRLYPLLALALLLSACAEAREPVAELPPLEAQPAAQPATKAPSEARPKPKPRPAATKRAARASQGVKLTGKTAALRQSALACQASGLLDELHVEEGQRVKKGQKIASLDKTMARLQLRQARAAVKGAKVQLKAARRESKRLKGLKAKKAIAQAKVDEVETMLEGALVQLEAGEAQAAMARQALKNATLEAPYAGVITRKMKAEGEWVSMMPPSPVVMLAQLDPLEVRLEAPESLLGQIKAGDPIRVHVRAVGRTLEAQIARVIPTVERNRAFTVVAEIPNEDGSLSSGLFVEAELAR